MPWRVLAAAVVVVVLVVASVALLGQSAVLVRWSDVLGFAGSILLLLPTGVTETLKWRRRQLAAKLARVRFADERAGELARASLRLLDDAIAAFSTWQAWAYLLGFYLVSLGFGLNAFAAVSCPR
jgi:hypothetical protein